MKRILLFSLVFAASIGCAVNEETRTISDYLDGFGKDINSYKVICFLPAEGCASCIEPSLEYSKTAGSDFLLIVSSLYKKSIRDIIENNNLNLDLILVDDKNYAVSLQLLVPTAPCFYFIEDGRVVKKADLSKTYDKTGILIEVSKFIGKSASE